MPDEFLLNDLNGVILSRNFFGDRKLLLDIFVKDYGIFSVFVNVGTSGRSHFGGDIEPFNWCRFALKKFSKSRSYTIQDVENYDDMLIVKRRPPALKLVLQWVNDIKKYLIQEQPDNSLLENLYDNMLLLKIEYIPVEVVNFRFKWNWLDLWGIAPELAKFFELKKFMLNEIKLLQFIVNFDKNQLSELFSNIKNHNPSYLEHVKKISNRAVKLIEGFFIEK